MKKHDKEPRRKETSYIQQRKSINGWTGHIFLGTAIYNPLLKER